MTEWDESADSNIQDDDVNNERDREPTMRKIYLDGALEPNRRTSI